MKMGIPLYTENWLKLFLFPPQGFISYHKATTNTTICPYSVWNTHGKEKNPLLSCLLEETTQYFGTINIDMAPDV